MPSLELTQVLFYAFAGVMLASSLAVISVRNPVYSVLFLVLTFFTAAALWMLLEAEFLAIVLVVVYVGAVMVLFLFVVMMLDINLEPLKEGFIRYLPAAVMVAVVMAIELLMVLWARGRFGPEAWPTPSPHPQGYSNTREIGEWLYSNYLLPFEVAGVILLVAIIAAVALTLRRRPEAKRQNPSRQVQVKPEERMRIVKMKSEPRSDR
jgi:NADH-quinone oxidoreductase subunit J